MIYDGDRHQCGAIVKDDSGKMRFCHVGATYKNRLGWRSCHRHVRGLAGAWKIEHKMAVCSGSGLLPFGIADDAAGKPERTRICGGCKRDIRLRKDGTFGTHVWEEEI